MGTIDDDRTYYKFRSIESDLSYMSRIVRESDVGVSAIITSEERRKDLRRLLAEIQKHVKSIQDRMGPEFNPEF